MVGRHDYIRLSTERLKEKRDRKAFRSNRNDVIHIEQVHDVQEAGSLRVHLFNPWNVVEATKLASLSTAFFFRMHAWVSY